MFPRKLWCIVKIITIDYGHTSIVTTTYRYQRRQVKSKKTVHTKRDLARFCCGCEYCEWLKRWRVKTKKKTLNLKGSDWSILLVARIGFRWLKYIVEWQIITKIDCCDYISLSTRFCMIKMTLKLWNCDIRDIFIRRSVTTRSLNISGDRRWDEIEKARGLWSIWYAEFSITWRKKRVSNEQILRSEIDYPKKVFHLAHLAEHLATMTIWASCALSSLLILDVGHYRIGDQPFLPYSYGKDSRWKEIRSWSDKLTCRSFFSYFYFALFFPNFSWSLGFSIYSIKAFSNCFWLLICHTNKLLERICS